jgi:SAM-dependent methyltransferase
MHESVMEWVGAQVEKHGLAPLRTLEIGSRDVNGSVRSLFTGEYVGLDAQTGKGVDVLATSWDIPFNRNTFDVVVSTSMLEHDRYFWRTLQNVSWVLKPGGYFILTTVSWGFFEHDKPDYYRFLPDSWETLMELADCEMIDSRDDPQSGGPQLTGRRR